jgi:hypothetical protein
MVLARDVWRRVGKKATDRLENFAEPIGCGWLLLSNGTVMLIAPHMFG